jgi:hypothetical protein
MSKSLQEAEEEQKKEELDREKTARLLIELFKKKKGFLPATDAEIEQYMAEDLLIDYEKGNLKNKFETSDSFKKWILELSDKLPFSIREQHKETIRKLQKEVGQEPRKINKNPVNLSPKPNLSKDMTMPLPKLPKFF